MEKLTGACIIGQSGGPTAVINASAQGVIPVSYTHLDVYKRQVHMKMGLLLFLLAAKLLLVMV